MEDEPRATGIQTTPETGETAARSLRFRLEMLLPIIAVPAFAIMIQFGLSERAHLLEDFADKADLVTTEIQRSQSAQIEQSRTILTELARAPQLQDPGSPECQSFLAGLLPVLPHFHNVGVSDVDGRVACIATTPGMSVDIADRDYFQQVVQDGKFSIGAYMIDRLTQVESVSFAAPIRRAGGEEIVGVVLALVSLDRWSQVLASVALPEGSVAFVTDRDRRILATFPNRPSLYGVLAADIGLDVTQQAPRGEAFAELGDGQRRLYSHHALFETGAGPQLAVSLGVPVDAALLAARNRLLLRLGIVTVALLLFWRLAAQVMERTIYRPFQALAEEIHALASGTERKGDSPPDSCKLSVAEFDRITRIVRKMSRDGQAAEAGQRYGADMMSSFLDTMPDIYFRVDADGRILDYRSGKETDLYVPPEVFLGRRMEDLLPPEIGKQFETNRLASIRSREVSSWEYELAIDGTPQFFEARLATLPKNNDSIAVIRNFTARREADLKRQAAEERLDRIIQNLPGAVIQREYVDGEHGQITYASPNCEAIWGYSVEEILNDPDLLVRAHDQQDLPRFHAAKAKAIAAKEPIQYRFMIERRDGECRWVDYFGSVPWRRRDGREIIESFFLDVTREVEAQLRYEEEREVAHRAQKQESVGQLTGGIAHDFNNLLAVILGNLELLHDDLVNPEQLRMVETGIRATQRGSDLTRSMLAFARRSRLEPEELALDQLVSEAHDWIGRTLPARIAVETSLAEDLWKIEADAASTESALLNLILNARDAMPDGGKLTIETANMQIDQTQLEGWHEGIERGRYVMLAVSDTGHGIPDEILSRVFEPFFSTKAPGAGSGLGLSMIEGFMRQSGGAVQVISEVGRGSAFRLYFPALAEDAETAAPTRADGQALRPSGGLRILVAEDEPDVLTMTVRMLEKAGHFVTPAPSGDCALDIFRADPSGFDLLLTDIVMPGQLQGTGLAMALREIVPDLKVVFMSGYAAEPTVHGNGVQAEDIRLMKPVMRAELLAALERARGG